MNVRNDIGYCLLLAGGTRAAALAVGVLGMVYLGTPAGAKLPPRSSSNVVLDIPARWDTGWYVGLASGGYKWDGRPGRFENVAFFPAYPLLLSGTAHALGAGMSEVGWNWSGVLLSTALFAAGLYGLLRLNDALGAGNNIWPPLACASYPFAIFYGLPYTEALFLLVTVAATLAAVRGRMIESALWGLAAGLTRPNGILLAILVGGLVLQRWLRTGAALRGWRLVDLAAVVAPIAGLGIYSAYVYWLTGNPAMWALVQSGWGREWANPLTTIVELLGALWDAPLRLVTTRFPDVLNACAGLLMLALAWPIWRRIGPPFAAYVIAGTLLPLSAGGWPALGRYTAVLFPAYLLAATLPKTLFVIALTAGILGQIVVAIMFFTWRPLY